MRYIKFIIFTFLLGILSSCSLLSLNTATYDANEYKAATHFAATLQLADHCHLGMVAGINAQIVELQLYSTGIPGNNLIVTMTDQLLKDSQELIAHKQPINDFYCKDKLDIMRRESITLQRSLGSKHNG